MANWAADFRLRNNIDPALIVKRARHGIHVRRPSGLIEASFVGKPCHYQDGSEWRELDTTLQAQANGYVGAPGIPVRFNLADRSVEIVGSGYAQRTARVAVFRPSSMAIVGTPRNIPVGSLDGDSFVASGTVGGAGWEHRLRLLEDGVKETLTLDSRPTLSGVQATDYLVMETEVQGIDWPDGEVAEFSLAGMHFPLPSCHDAMGAAAPCKRIAKRDGAKLLLYTGIPVTWLASAVYPVVLDPDFASTSSGTVYSLDMTYSICRNTPSYTYFLSAAYSWSQIGQSHASGSNYEIDRAFLAFDTSSILAGSTVTQDNLTLTCTVDWAVNREFDVNILKHNWSAQDPITTDNMLTAFNACLSSPEDSSIWRNTAGMSLNTPYTSGNLDPTWVVVAGTTYWSLVSHRDYDTPGSTPGTGTVKEYIYIATYSHATESYRPVLTVLYELSASGPAIARSPMWGRF